MWRHDDFLDTGTSGLWNTAGNWSPPQVPGATDDVLIGAAGNYPVLASGTVVVNSLMLNDAGAELEVGGNMTVSAALALNAGTIDIQSGDTLTANNPSVTSGSIIDDGTLALAGSYDTAVLNSISFGTSAAIALSGTLNNTGTTFDALIPAYEAFSPGTLTVEGGTIIRLPTIINLLTLVGVTAESPAALGEGAAIGFNGTAVIENGLHLLNGSTKNPGDLILFGQTLIFQGDQIFDNGTISADSYSGSQIESTGSLTLGLGALVEAIGNSTVLSGLGAVSLTGPGTFINQGTLTTSAGYFWSGIPQYGGGFDIHTAFNNAGLINAAGGYFTSYGTLNNLAGGIISSTSAFSNAGTNFFEGQLQFAGAATNAGIITNHGDAYFYSSLTNSGTIASDGYTLGISGSAAVTNTGTVVSTAGTVTVSGSLALNNDGLISIAQGGADIGPAVTLANNGTMLLGSGGSVTIEPFLSGTGTLDLGRGSVAEISNVAAAQQTVDFLNSLGNPGDATELILDQPVFAASSILDFAPGDTIDLGVAATGVGYFGNVLTMQTTGSVSFGLNIVGSYTFSNFAITTGSNSTTIVVSCFAADTRIATECGDVPVEELREGDRVQALLSAEPRRITWIGRRHVDCLRHPRPSEVWPVRIAAGAFGPGQPRRPLYLSPDHAVFADDVLIPIKYLINGTTIAQMRPRSVTYYHVQLACHDILLADGLATESYLDTGDQANFANGAGPARLHADFSSRVWESCGCAPLVITGPIVEAVRKRLDRRDAEPPSKRRAACCSGLFLSITI